MRLEYFEMIDAVTRLDLQAGTIEASAKVPDASPVFEGHFPGHSGAGRVLLTETMAQASGYLILAHLGFERMPFLTGVDKARFRSFVGPSAALTVTAKLEHDGCYAVTKAAITHEGKALCDAELRFRTMPFPDGLDAPMRCASGRRAAASSTLPVSAGERQSEPSRPRHRNRPRLCAGEGPEAHLAALASGAVPRTDAQSFAPYPVHPAPAIAWDRQIPKKSDQRQMEAWQRLGVYAAGLALEAAGVKEDAAFKQALHLVVAAGGGERDYAADGAILTGLRDAPESGAFLNERLQNDLRPTLFLAQLSNLLAGNIAIVHGVTGASRTFMGEEAAAASMPCASPGRGSPPARTRRCWSAAPTAPNGRMRCSSMPWEASRSRAITRRSSIAQRRAASSWRVAPLSCCSNPPTTRKHAVPRPSPGWTRSRADAAPVSPAAWRSPWRPGGRRPRPPAPTQ